METVGSVIENHYVGKTPNSRALYERAQKVIPGGVTHDVRVLKPYPISMERAQGSRKWDVDGNEYVDYFGGHGAFLLGHNHPAVVEAVRRQLEKGTHFGSSHELELEWAELICRMVPSAEKVRFTSSGTESSLLAIRIARAFTGKDRIIRFESHFHGWHDQVAYAAASHFDGTIPAGIPAETTKNIILCVPNNGKRIRQILADDDDIAAIFIEPTGSTYGQVPTGREVIAELRKIADEYKILLVFDEVITGFRVAPGGAQEILGVIPDLTLLAKTLAGGYPGGAVAGRADVMDVLTARDDPDWNYRSRVAHQGTFNANPISAAAGLATLKLIATTDITEKASQNGEMLRNALNDVIREQDSNWLVYGEYSGFHIFPNHEDIQITIDSIYAGRVHYRALKGGTPAHLIWKIRAGMILGGVDVVAWPGGWVSGIHTEDDIAITTEAFKHLLVMIREDRPRT